MGWWSPTSAPVTTGWINRHQFCLAHVQRNLQEMAEYSGGGQNGLPWSSARVLFKGVFRTQHSYEAEQLVGAIMVQANAAITTKYPKVLLTKGCEGTSRRYAGRCQHILKYEAGLWVFLVPFRRR